VRALIDPAADGSTLLALEWLALQPPGAGFGARFGTALGALHTAPAAPAFGWARNNMLGGTPQDNRAVDPPLDWVRFFNQRRLQPLHDRLAALGASTALLDAVQRVIARWGTLAPAAPRPSLIHGDLWSGNWGMLTDGSPVIFDPAVSRSHAEAELAMMELFGSPPAGFWPAYAEAAGHDAAGYARRRPVYQLYHLLNHALLFGGSYGEQALACAQLVLRQV
jgi:fructosamine-3-kinase